jgi:hypothetical protein
MLLYVYYYLAHLKHLMETAPSEVDKHLVTYQNVLDLIEAIYEPCTEFENAEAKLQQYDRDIATLESEIQNLQPDFSDNFKDHFAIWLNLITLHLLLKIFNDACYKETQINPII